MSHHRGRLVSIQNDWLSLCLSTILFRTVIVRRLQLAMKNTISKAEFNPCL